MSGNSQPNSTGTKNSFFPRRQKWSNNDPNTLFQGYFIGPSFTNTSWNRAWKKDYLHSSCVLQH